MRNAHRADRDGACSLTLATIALMLATPLAALGAERMVLGEYFTATW